MATKAKAKTASKTKKTATRKTTASKKKAAATKATVDSEVKITAAIERLHERLYGPSESNAAEQLMELYKHIKMETVPTRHPSIEELTANGGTYSGCGA